MQKGKEGKRAGLDEVERKAELGHLRRLSLICTARVKRALVLLELRQLQLKAVLPPLSLYPFWLPLASPFRYCLSLSLLYL